VGWMDIGHTRQDPGITTARCSTTNHLELEDMVREYLSRKISVYIDLDRPTRDIRSCDSIISETPLQHT